MFLLEVKAIHAANEVRRILKEAEKSFPEGIGRRSCL